MIALLDENLPPCVALALRSLKEKAVHVVDSDGPGRGTTDLELFRWLRGQGDEWCLVTRDLRQSKNPQELHAMKSHQLGVFQIQARRDLTVFGMGELIVRNWRSMSAICDTESRPFIYALKPNAPAPIKIQH